MLKKLTTLNCTTPGIFGTSGLLIAAVTACSPPLKHSAQPNHRDHDQMTPTAATTLAKLSTPNSARAQTLTPLLIDVQGLDGQAINKFDNFQEKLMHLIIVSDDLKSFSHVHPVHKKNGRFETMASFPAGGNYTLISDYQPTGQSEQVSVMKTTVAGTGQAPAKMNLDNNKTSGDIKVSWKNTLTPLSAGTEVSLAFTLQRKNGRPITDLQPYLGEKGHLVIIKQSTPLTRADYIHAHALKGGQQSEVVFITKFPQPGKYKMWGQFKHQGKVVVSDFWVNVSWYFIRF